MKASDKEFQGFIGRESFVLVYRRDSKQWGKDPLNNHKDIVQEQDGRFIKRKVSVYIRGKQQKMKEQYDPDELYTTAFLLGTSAASAYLSAQQTGGH